MARTMLISAKHLPKNERLWAEAVNAACYIRNRLFSSATSETTKTPYEILLNKKPDLSNLRIFGSKSYVHIPKAKRQGKFSERAKVGYLVGYDRGNSYRIYLPDEEKVVISRDVRVDESALLSPHRNSKDDPDKEDYSIEFDDPFKSFCQKNTGSGTDRQEDDAQDDEVLKEDAQEDIENDNIPPEDPNKDSPESLTHDNNVRRSSRPRKPPVRMGFESAMFVHQARMKNEDSTTPLTYTEAVSGKDSQKWKAAMDHEMQQFNEMKTWKLVYLPEGARTVKNKWVYFTKRDAQNRLTRRRARLVAKGFTQKKGIYYDEVFAPVAKYSTVRMMLAFAVQEDLEMLLLDVKAAFLNGELDEVIFMEQPEGYVIKVRETMVYRLLKAIYGLKQASRAWRKLINDFLKNLGCTQSNMDSSLYSFIIDGEKIYILVYVDDILLLGRIMSALKNVAQKIAEKFQVRIEESVTKFLGIIIEQDSARKTVKIHSCTLIDQMIDKFGMAYCKPVKTPLPEGIALSMAMKPVDEEAKLIMQKTPYRQLVGCILHLANTTRPDIAFAAGYLSRFMSEPGISHWKAAKHVLRYLKGTRKLGIPYEWKEENTTLHGFSDSDFAGDVDKRKSTSGNCFLFGGGAVAWMSKKQGVVAQSSVEAEYIALSFAVREALWLRKLEVILGNTATPLTLAADNQGALSLAHDDVHNSRSKHIDVKYHFIRECISQGIVVTKYVPSSLMIADIMTKALGGTKHWLFTRMMGMVL